MVKEPSNVISNCLIVQKSVCVIFSIVVLKPYKVIRPMFKTLSL